MLGATGIAALVGGAGLGVDTVQWYLWQRQLQQAVDSSALAGALNLYQGEDYSTAATSELNRNANTTVTIERLANPPAVGAYAGSNSAVEVVATTSRQLPFSSLFLTVAPTIRARAVATSIEGDEHCVISLAPAGVGVQTVGNPNVVLGCGVAANSWSEQWIYLDGTAWLEANPLSSVGGIHQGGNNVPSGTALLTYAQPLNDPIADRGLSVPSTPAACTYNNYTVSPSTTVTLNPGRYCGGLRIRGTATLNPGVYIIDGGNLVINAQATVIGHGVTFVLTGNSPSTVASVSIAGGADLDLRAPTQAEDATWYDMLIYQDPTANNQNNTLAGGSGTQFNGIVYMPNGDVNFTGNSNGTADCLLIVSYRVSFTGDANIGNNCPSTIDDLDLRDRRIRVVE
ncbi:MAG TPA: Tad domain-containing protein [Sphingomonadaceae bacterium]|nr:Tad domain-containing protein [Sphingomonadaceae bacterium]